MKTLFISVACLCFPFLLFSCEEGENPVVKVSKDERTWIPYTDNQQIQFVNDKNQIVTLQAEIKTTEISQSGKSPSSLINQEQIALTLHGIAPNTNSLSLALRPNKILIGSYFDASGSGIEAVIEKKINKYEITEDKHTYYTFVPEITLNGKEYKNIFYRHGHADASGFGTFSEYYYAKGKGLLAFKLNNQEDWYHLK